jgi:hypothetical protein
MNRGIALHNLGRRDESNAVWREIVAACVRTTCACTGVCLFHLGVDCGRRSVAHDEALQSV